MDASTDLALPLELQNLSNLLDKFPETLALGNQDLGAAALHAAKYAFDLSIQSEASSKCHVVDLVSSLSWSQAPQTRSRANMEAGKPSPQLPDKNFFDSTPLKSLYIDGMDEEQIWEQLDLRTKTICRVLDFVLEGEVEEGQDNDNEGEDGDEDEEKLLKALEDLEGDEDINMDDVMGEESEGSSGQSSSQSSSPSGSDLEDEEEEENYSSLRDPSSDEDGDGDIEPPALRSPNPSHSRKKRGRNAAVSEIDDDFFNLAEFNAETERAEARSSSKGRLAEDDESDEDMEIDLFTPVDPVDNFDEEDLENNTDALFYKDFFQVTPPSPAGAKTKSKMRTSRTNQVRFHEQVRVKKIKPTGKNKSLHMDDSDDDSEDEDDSEDDNLVEEDEAEIDADELEWSDDEEMDDSEEGEEDENEENLKPSNRQTVERLKHDLFAEEEEEVQDDLTTHESRMAALRDQIVELESENVAKKDWVLMGEAGSRQRPQNSLLEEDLEFDRVMKAVPVITEEAVQSLEEIIKARILEGRFDDVIRLRPLDDKPFLPSKFFELQDSKSTQSLAQIYENDYISAQSGVPSDDRDGKLKKEHDEISQLWEKICNKLDALCNAHFVPKQPKATISTIANVATATLESALPTSKSTATMLAPEEIFATSSSLQRARSELTPVEKRAMRTRERKARQRQRNALDKSVDKYAKVMNRGSVKQQKQAALQSVVKHGKGVTVVGKKGVKDKKT